MSEPIFDGFGIGAEVARTMVVAAKECISDESQRLRFYKRLLERLREKQVQVSVLWVDDPAFVEAFRLTGAKEK